MLVAVQNNIKTISGSLNNLTNYISATISDYLVLTCNIFIYYSLTVFKPQTELTTYIAFQQFINQII